MMATVLVIADDAVELADILNRYFVVKAASDFTDALEILERDHVCVALSAQNVGSSVGSGFVILREVQRLYPRIHRMLLAECQSAAAAIRELDPTGVVQRYTRAGDVLRDVQNLLGQPVMQPPSVEPAISTAMH